MISMCPFCPLLSAVCMGLWCQDVSTRLAGTTPRGHRRACVGVRTFGTRRQCLPSREGCRTRIGARSGIAATAGRCAGGLHVGTSLVMTLFF
jgi:hypothetical protein